MEFRDLKQQYRVLQKDMDRAILEAIASGAYIMGPQVRELEQQLAEYVGVKHCLTCANGTDALTLALKAWGIGPGDAVFVPGFTFFSSAEVAPLEGATPIPMILNVRLNGLWQKANSRRKSSLQWTSSACRLITPASER